MVNIEQLEKKIPELLEQKICEDVDLTALTRLTFFNKSCIPTISKLTGTYIQPVMGSETMVCFNLTTALIYLETNVMNPSIGYPPWGQIGARWRTHAA